MTEASIAIGKKKKIRINIRTIEDFKSVLKKENYLITEFNDEKLKAELMEIFDIDKVIAEEIFLSLKSGNVNYRSNDIVEFIDYITNIVRFEEEHEKLCEKIYEFNKLNIERIEYERVLTEQDEVKHITKVIEEIKDSISGHITEEEMARIEDLEKEISEDYLYAKDIELLKKIIFNSSPKEIKENYNNETKVKTISIKIPKEIKKTYIKPNKGTIEYYQHLKNNIPRMKRLRKNIHKYMKIHEDEVGTFNINQSEALQDSINIAVATYNNKEFKAVSGSDEVEGYCALQPIGQTAFKSSKVNKLGKLGIGYDRVNDSEKKILEEIHKQIQSKVLNDNGELILYSKWQPCPSCYYVIGQFCKKYPNIKFQVKYSKKYGDLNKG